MLFQVLVCPMEKFNFFNYKRWPYILPSHRSQNFNFRQLYVFIIHFSSKKLNFFFRPGTDSAVCPGHPPGHAADAPKKVVKSYVSGG